MNITDCQYLQILMFQDYPQYLWYVLYVINPLFYTEEASNKSSPFIIPNWTRYGKNCYSAAYFKASTKNQCNLDQYLGSGQSSQLQLGSVINQAESNIPAVEENHDQVYQSVPQSHDLSNDISPYSTPTS